MPMSNTFAPADLRAVLTEGFDRSPLSGEGFEVFTSSADGRFLAKGFIGKSAKQAFYYRFSSAEKRDAYVAEWAAGRVKVAELKASRKAAVAAEKAAFDARAVYKVGDVIHHSWGYEQTQCDFYKVVSVPGKATLELIAIGSKDSGQPSGRDSAYVLADIDRVIGEKSFRVRCNPHGVSLKHGHASKWDGRPEYRSWYY